MELHETLFHEFFVFKNLLTPRFFEVRFSNEVGAMKIKKLSIVEWNGTSSFFEMVARYILIL
jgi:hypothetical protein